MNEYSLDLGNIYIFGEICNNLALRFQYKIDYFLSTKAKNINIFINSCGGSVDDALSIVDRINYAKSKININTIGLGQVASSACYILVAGSHRYATESTTFLLHSMSHTLSDYHSHLEKYMKFNHNFHNNLMTDLAMNCGKKNPKAIQKFLKQVNDTMWLNVEEAIQLGLIEEEWKS